MTRIKILVSISFLVAACGSPPAPSSSPASQPAVAQDAPDLGEGIAWADKSKAQKGAFMQARVVPAMAEIWKDSPNPDEEVSCATCHGAGASTGEFAMPSTGIPALNPSDQFAAHKDEGEWLGFMMSKVLPTMTKTLGVEAFNMETKTGFSCFACHTMVAE